MVEVLNGKELNGWRQPRLNGSHPVKLSDYYFWDLRRRRCAHPRAVGQDCYWMNSPHGRRRQRRARAVSFILDFPRELMRAINSSELIALALQVTERYCVIIVRTACAFAPLSSFLHPFHFHPTSRSLQAGEKSPRQLQSAIMGIDVGYWNSIGH
eukprot:scaffold26759_cov30-Tisochrysis_lutea.AAC.2